MLLYIRWPIRRSNLYSIGWWTGLHTTLTQEIPFFKGISTHLQISSILAASLAFIKVPPDRIRQFVSSGKGNATTGTAICGFLVSLYPYDTPSANSLAIRGCTDRCNKKHKDRFFHWYLLECECIKKIISFYEKDRYLVWIFQRGFNLFAEQFDSEYCDQQ